MSHRRYYLSHCRNRLRPISIKLLAFLVSYLYYFRCNTDCWKFDGAGLETWQNPKQISLHDHTRLQRSVQNIKTRPPSPAMPSKTGNFFTMLSAQQQDVLFSCPLNSMCQCVSLPNDTSNLIEINCNEVPLYKFPEFIHSSVRYIEMSNTHLQSVDDETFQGLRLKTLKLMDNELQDISERSFSTMTHSLMTLDISGNKMYKIPLEALKKLHSLTRLVVQRNYISTIDGNWEAQSDSLRSLHLAYNDINEVSMNNQMETSSNDIKNGIYPTIAPASQTHQVYSEASNIIFTNMLNAGASSRGHSTGKSFSKLQKLLWLDLSNNRINHIVANFLPQSLVTIDISSNLLNTFPHQLFQHLHDLRIISLRDNLLHSVHSKDQHPMQMHLEKLDLGQNLLETLETDYFQNNYTKVHIRALNVEKNFIKQLPAEVFRDTGIVHLVLAFNNIENIHHNTFDGISETLEYLDLEHNFLQVVPSAISNLQKLKYLYLTSNKISYLNNLPKYTDNLRVISLSGNNFSMIPVLGLKNYTQLSYLNMGYNSISDIPEDIFSVDGWGANLQTLLLRNNKITHLHLGSLNGLDQIQEISLSFNDINIHHQSVFENVSRTLKILELSFAVFPARNLDSLDPLEALQPLSQLMWLGLDNNNLKFISNDSFANMRELSYINLSFNQLKHLPKGLFIPDVHSHLVEIDLSYNSLQLLASKTFNNLGDLQTLNLQSNRLKTIEKHAFYNLEFLRYIDLSYNHISNISNGAFAIMPNLAVLDLMHNSLCTISLKIFHFISNITTPLKLNLTHNRITHFGDELSSYMYIYNLDVSHNYISKPNSFTSLANSLRILNLAHNLIYILGSNAFGDLEFLEVLNLSYNNITSLRRRSFQGLKSLQELDLSHNQLDQLQVEQFSNLLKLRILRINNNHLRALPREVFMNTRLEFLDISHNQLSVWPVPAFSDVGFTLRSIQMQCNYIEYLDSSMFINSQFLYDVNLAANKITVLPDNTFIYLTNLRILNLSKNPLVASNLKEVFLRTTRLRKLILIQLGLYVLPKLKLPFLSHLDLSENNLQELSPLNEMQYLRYLNISQNKFVNISCAVEHIPSSVRVFDLSHNPIKRITLHDMISLKHLTELNIIGIKIVNPQFFSKLRSLRKIHLTSHSYLGDIVSRIPGLQDLHVHYIDRTLQSQFFSKLVNNTKLQYVEIYGSNLQSISPHALTPLSNNQQLHLKISYTGISDLPPCIFYTLRDVPNLYLDLSHNKINILAADSFYPNKTFWDAVGTRSIIGGLVTSHNPLECECGLVWYGHWLRRWLRESAQIKVIQKDDLKRMVQRARENTCHDPITRRQLPILEIFPEDLLCQASALSSSSGSLLFLSITSICIPIFSLLLYLQHFI